MAYGTWNGSGEGKRKGGRKEVVWITSEGAPRRRSTIIQSLLNALADVSCVSKCVQNTAAVQVRGNGDGWKGIFWPLVTIGRGRSFVISIDY